MKNALQESKLENASPEIAAPSVSLRVHPLRFKLVRRAAQSTVADY